MKATKRGNRIIVESDEPGEYWKHSSVAQGRLASSMHENGISEVTGDNVYQMEHDFNRQYKEKHGTELSYFGGI